ncbi:hypothetical protein BDW66DRAFT_153900 [Aspergillus desertorum]
MSLRWLLLRLLLCLVPLAVTTTVHLYLYPVFSGCAYPLPLNSSNASQPPSAFIHTLKTHLIPQSASDQDPAIFRLLVLADPQLEGDSSLPRPENELGARIKKHWSDTLQSIHTAPFPIHLVVWRTISAALRCLLAQDLPRAFAAQRKRLDLLGNDYYLAHIYRTLHWWTKPTHVAVLGDLIGSQWVTDEEFQRRGNRYWRRVFKGGERVDDEITRTGKKRHAGRESDKVKPEELLPSSPSWAHRIINVVGNHDVGYSGDASERRISRFEEVFGRANWDIRFQHPPIGNLTPSLHLINLNSLTLDGPAYSGDIQGQGYAYINSLIERLCPVGDRSTFTLLLTHLPLHKPEGVCTDGPYFTFFEKDDESGKERYKAGGLREQNHLSEHVSSNGILQGIFGMSGDEGAPAGGRGRNGLILTGHDHTGCDVVHSVQKQPPQPPVENIDGTLANASEGDRPCWTWKATRYDPSAPQSSSPFIREITLRSMMGEYGGNAGLLSLWFDTASSEWKYAVTMCPVGVQHIWWAVHVVDLITLIVAALYALDRIFGYSGSCSSSKPLAGVAGRKKTR